MSLNLLMDDRQCDNITKLKKKKKKEPLTGNFPIATIFSTIARDAEVEHENKTGGGWGVGRAIYLLPHL